jgi:polysaccharide biosynthesis/export protein
MFPAAVWTQEPASGARSIPGLAPGDQIDIHMYDFPDLGAAALHITVAADGDIHVPYAGAVHVAGLSPSAAERTIENALRDKGVVKEPAVSVDVVLSANLSVEVIGQVKTPQALPLFGPAPISWVMSKSGGLTGLAAKYVTIIHPADFPPTTIPYDPDSPDVTAMNTPVYPGDIVHVSSQGVFFIIGEVLHPGIIPLGGALSVGQTSPIQGMGIVNHMTLLKALTDAGGITPIAARSKTRILRTVDGKREEIIVDITKLEKGQIADPILHADDIIYVPSSYIRSQTNNIFSTAISSLYATQAARSF